MGSASVPVPVITTRLTRRDWWGTVKVRLGIDRMRYRVAPGLYAIGEPTGESPVLVTANYKLTFDMLRRELDGVAAWLLVIDTDGVNVWCAAGKGTFSTDAVVRAVEAVGLVRVVTRKRLILPQLAAPGVAAHEVRERTGFYVTFGPVRAEDLPAFLHGGLKATDEMRRVRFTICDRMVLVPVDFLQGLKVAAPIALGVFAAAGLSREGFDTDAALRGGWPDALAVLGATAAGLVATPTLLPWLPGRPFFLKGAWMGLAWVGLWMLFRGRLGLPVGLGTFAVHALLLVPLSGFFAFNLTGSTTFTSLSGVQLEMIFVVPLALLSAIAGIVLWLAVGAG